MFLFLRAREQHKQNAYRYSLYAYNTYALLEMFVNPITEQLICFTDGSALTNGTENCKCGYSVVWPYYSDYDDAKHLANGTNNQAEYHAVILAFEVADKIDPTKNIPLVVYTDSQLLINSMTKWISGWKKNNWKTSNKQPVKNKELIEHLDSLMSQRVCSFKHVKAHTYQDTFESNFNRKADRAAVEAAKL